MKNYKLMIQYDGGRYKGWQRLGGEEATIQGKMEGVLTEMTGRETELIGSSRTDAGVHAMGQVANFKMVKPMSEAEIKTYLNHYLPQDIAVKSVQRVAEAFHARYHAKEKTYVYQIWNREEQNPFLRKYSMQVKASLDLSAMERAAGHCLGQHDFTSFTNAKSNKKSMVRTIDSITFEEQDGLIRICICGDGFLYNMVRKLVGTLIAVGTGATMAEEMPGILAAKDRSLSGVTAEACGLFLQKVAF